MLSAGSDSSGMYALATLSHLSVRPCVKWVGVLSPFALKNPAKDVASHEDFVAITCKVKVICEKDKIRHSISSSSSSR